MHVRLDVALHVGGPVGNGQLEGFVFFTELYHFHGILNCLSVDCHLASFEWYGPYQQCFDALLKYTNPSENILIEIMEISALHAELHNDGFDYSTYQRNWYTVPISSAFNTASYGATCHLFETKLVTGCGGRLYDIFISLTPPRQQAEPLVAMQRVGTSKDYILSDGDMSNRNAVVVIRERYANRVSLFSIRNRNGFEEDIDGVLSSGSFYYRTCYGNPFGFDSAVCAALLHKALLQSNDSSRVHDIHIDNGFLRNDESEQVVTSLQQLGLTFYDASTNVHGRLTLSLCRTVNPEEKRRIIDDMFVKVIDRTANDLNVTWDNLLFVKALRPYLIESASHMASSRADAIKAHHNDSEMARYSEVRFVCAFTAV
ncbi:hypothetical protein OUZ56_004025 [Daphnia magna]|uniref:GMPS ATP-PPase domain-containing protein n=1 Tax=Daphnia magna TaxID=35525 RepID=A0ABQ9YNI9_9CRUS|nr:hypothetical protein OUZ56_004025 [Daphnia magna]